MCAPVSSPDRAWYETKSACGKMELTLSVAIKAVAVIACVAVVSLVLRAVLNSISVYCKLKNVPTERESQHWLLGHGPKVS